MGHDRSAAVTVRRSGAVGRERDANAYEGLAGHIDERVLVEDFAVGLRAAREGESASYWSMVDG